MMDALKDAPDWLSTAAAVFTSLGILAAGMWWLVWPRIEDKLEAVALGVRNVDEQLGDKPGTTGAHAKAAARAAEQLPAIFEQLDQQARQLGAIGPRLEEIEAWRREWERGGWERRLGSVEEALIALLGRELRNRVLADDDPTEQHHHHHIERPDLT